MKDINEKLQYKGKEYTLVFNLNVLEKIQEEYGSIDKWGELTESEEPDIKAVIFGFEEMINEGIEIANDENGTDEPLLTHKQVGRIITDIGIKNATETVKKTVVESTQSETKNS